MEVVPPLISRILESLNREVLNQLDLAGSIAHPGENGRAREQIVAAYLRRLLPQDFGLDTGFVIDAAGSISKQVDLVMYRRGYHPVFEIGGVKHFIVESVSAVIENKASIPSVQKLHEALDNIRSVKVLDRTSAGRNYLVRAGSQTRGPSVDPQEFAHQVFGAIVTEHSLSQENLKDAFLDYFHRNPDRRYWPNMYADLRGASARFLKGTTKPEAMTVSPTEAQYLCLSKPEGSDYVPPLLDLTFELVNFLRVAPLVDFRPTDYFKGGMGANTWWPLAP